VAGDAAGSRTRTGPACGLIRGATCRCGVGPRPRAAQRNWLCGARGKLQRAVLFVGCQLLPCPSGAAESCVRFPWATRAEPSCFVWLGLVASSREKPGSWIGADLWAYGFFLSSNLVLVTSLLTGF
jgi:hypothetical protein